MAVVLLVGAGIAALLVFPLFLHRETWDLDETPDQLRNIKRARDRVMRTLKDLEADQREGSLDENDYEELRSTYKSEAIKLTRELRRVRESVVRQIRQGPDEKSLTDDERKLLEKRIARRAKKYEAV